MRALLGMALMMGNWTRSPGCLHGSSLPPMHLRTLLPALSLHLSPMIHMSGTRPVAFQLYTEHENHMHYKQL